MICQIIAQRGRLSPRIGLSPIPHEENAGSDSCDDMTLHADTDDLSYNRPEQVDPDSESAAEAGPEFSPAPVPEFVPVIVGEFRGIEAAVRLWFVRK